MNMNNIPPAYIPIIYKANDQRFGHAQNYLFDFTIFGALVSDPLQRNGNFPKSHTGIRPVGGSPGYPIWGK